MQRAKKVWTLCVIVMVGLVAATAFHLYVGKVLGMGYPANTFLWFPEQRFSDFYVIFEPVKQGSPLSGAQSVYFPFAYVPLYPLVGLSWQAAYAVVVLIFSATVFLVLWQHLDFLAPAKRATAAFIIPFLSLPAIGCFDRGNIEFIIIVFVLAFFGLFMRGKYLWSALPLAAAIAMKAYPGAFGLLLLMRRQYRAAALTALLTAVFTLGSAAAFPGGIRGTIRLMGLRMDYLKDTYIYNPFAHYGSSNYLSIVKLFFRLPGLSFSEHRGAILLAYSAVSALLFAAVAWYVYAYERVVWKQVFLLSTLIIVLPQVSFDYKLMHLLLPTVLFLAAPSGRRSDDLLYVALLGFLIIPFRYFPLGAETSISVVLRPLAMTVMAGHIMWRGLRTVAEAQGHLTAPATVTA